jgi:hypothetical protein
MPTRWSSPAPTLLHQEFFDADAWDINGLFDTLVTGVKLSPPGGYTWNECIPVVICIDANVNPLYTERMITEQVNHCIIRKSSFFRRNWARMPKQSIKCGGELFLMALLEMDAVTKLHGDISTLYQDPSEWDEGVLHSTFFNLTWSEIPASKHPKKHPASSDPLEAAACSETTSLLRGASD